jgi:hypothetical protein
MIDKIPRDNLLKAYKLDNQPALLLRELIAQYCTEHDCSTDEALAKIDINNHNACGDTGGVNVYRDSDGDASVEYTSSQNSNWMTISGIIEQALSPAPDAIPDWWDEAWTCGADGKSSLAREIERDIESDRQYARDCEKELSEEWGE